MVNTDSHLGYYFDSEISEDGRVRRLYRFDCTRCPAHIWIIPGRLTNERVAEQARRRGWAAHHARKADALCPTCQHRNRHPDQKELIMSLPPP